MWLHISCTPQKNSLLKDSNCISCKVCFNEFFSSPLKGCNNWCFFCCCCCCSCNFGFSHVRCSKDCLVNKCLSHPNSRKQVTVSHMKTGLISLLSDQTYRINCVHKDLAEEICCVKVTHFWNPFDFKTKQRQVDVVCLKDIIRHICVCPVIDHEFRHNSIKVAVDPRGDSLVDPQTTLTKA